MTKKAKPLLKITATLLNSWNYQFICPPQYANKSREEFIGYLNREPFEPNVYMKRGIEFEDKCVEGNVPYISEVIEGGAFQAYVEKDIQVDDYDIRLLGYLDVLKEGTIYDIKRVNKYEIPKYFTSYQHHIYLELVDEAKEFKYLVASGYNDSYLNMHVETYRRDEQIDIKGVIRQFFDWLKENGLFETYIENYTIKESV